MATHGAQLQQIASAEDLLINTFVAFKMKSILWIVRVPSVAPAITGTLLEVGYHTREPESMMEILSERKRALAGATAPARGLCLIKVDYS